MLTEVFYESNKLPEYHIVQTCIPLSVPLERCHQEGYMFVVVGQETYDESPFTHSILKTMDADVAWYYVVIVLIFLAGNGCLFVVLWTWLRIRVTDRMLFLKNKIQANVNDNDKIKHSYSSYEQQNKLMDSNRSSVLNQTMRRNSQDLRLIMA